MQASILYLPLKDLRLETGLGDENTSRVFSDLFAKAFHLPPLKPSSTFRERLKADLVGGGGGLLEPGII